METIKEMLNYIKQSGLNDYQIADAVTANGYKTAQSQIHRLRSGVLKQTNYARGAAIYKLYKSRLRKKPKK